MSQRSKAVLALTAALVLPGCRSAPQAGGFDFVGDTSVRPDRWWLDKSFVNRRRRPGPPS